MTKAANRMRGSSSRRDLLSLIRLLGAISDETKSTCRLSDCGSSGGNRGRTQDDGAEQLEGELRQPGCAADRPVAPGQTDSFTVSLRFAPTGTPAASLGADAYQSWARTWPAQLNWSDRRVIGTVYLASSPQGNVTQPGGYPNNPRRYFNNSNASDFDVRTAQGLSNFQAKVLQQAGNTVQNLHLLNAQGAITWDLEGEQYPQETSYVCSPDQIAQVAPEMESVIANGSSPYAGMKLDDAYFKIMRDAGFRVGVCIRPQHFTMNRDGTAQQVSLANADVAAEVIRKMKYAHDRWGATLFYIDSTVEPNGAVLDAGIFQQAAAALPDSLLIPEETTPKDLRVHRSVQDIYLSRGPGNGCVGVWILSACVQCEPDQRCGSGEAGGRAGAADQGSEGGGHPDDACRLLAAK